MAISSIVEAGISHRSPADFLLSLICLWIIYTIILATYSIFFHPLRKVPGPVLAKFTSRWQNYHASRLQKAHAIQAAHLKYGPIIRISPSEISCSDPSELRAIYGHHSPVLKTEFYIGGRFTEEDNVFSMRDKHQHGARRKLMSHNFATAPLLESMPHIINKAKVMIKHFERLGDHGPVEVSSWFHLFGLEIVYMQTIGRDPKMLENGKEHDVIKDLELFQTCFAWTAIFPPLRRFGAKIPIKQIQKPFQALASWEKFCLNVVAAERKLNPAHRAQFINRMMENKDEYLGRKLTDLEIAEEVIGILFAGSGTTANTLVFLVYAVAKDRRVFNLLRDELTTKLQGAIFEPDLKLCQNLRYTNAIILETLRLYPTIPGYMPRIAHSPIAFNGQIFPAKTVFGAQNYSLHRSKNYFPNPEDFYPERFLGSDDQERMARAGLNPFSSGPRGCLGRNLAMMELQLLVPMLFRYFDDITVDSSMTEGDMAMVDGFSGGPAGKKLLLNFAKIE